MIRCLAVGAVYSYSAYERYRFMQAWVTSGSSRPIERDTSARTLSESALLDEENQGSILPKKDDDPAVEMLAAIPKIPIKPSPATWIRISKVGVDSPVVHAPIENGEWQVPKFVVGHLEGTADLYEIGNVVLSGHVESLASGNVFARLKDLAVDDSVVAFAGDDAIPYSVKEVKVVKNDDLSVVAPTPEPVLNLITCAGTWDPIARDYSERLIVVARPDSLERTG